MDGCHGDVVMELLRTWVIGLAAGLLLVLLGRVARRRGLNRPPLVVPLVATAVWTLLRSLPLGALPTTTRLWLSSLDDLLVVYAAVQLVIWGCFEVPGSLGWWRRPPKLLLQLLALGGCAIGTVVVIRQATRFDLVGLVTTSAVLTAVIGLAAQEPLKDLLAGLELQLTSDFELGDFIHLSDEVRGVVVSVSWRDTTLRNIDGALILSLIHI